MLLEHVFSDCLNCCLHNRVAYFRLRCVTVPTCMCQFHCYSKIGISALNEHPRIILPETCALHCNHSEGSWVGVWVCVHYTIITLRVRVCVVGVCVCVCVGVWVCVLMVYMYMYTT